MIQMIGNVNRIMRMMPRGYTALTFTNHHLQFTPRAPLEQSFAIIFTSIWGHYKIIEPKVAKLDNLCTSYWLFVMWWLYFNIQKTEKYSIAMCYIEPALTGSIIIIATKWCYYNTARWYIMYCISNPLQLAFSQGECMGSGSPI